ncbi:MAG: hypothetical protein D6721_04775 [Gammaproteobacteria bacterium]|nr:MAG: hypothetical protein D6721_04775 [Gammaproteobacteria bacterium]
MKIRIVVLLLCLFGMAAARAEAGFEARLQALQRAWAQANYQTPKEKVDAAFARLDRQARELVQAYPDRAAAKLWEAIVLASRAGKVGGFHALGWVRRARDLLLEAARSKDPGVLGSVYTTLGSLYYKVPRWPLAFGDRDKARAYLEKAVQLAPESIDANYFYADFLASEGQYAEAMRYARKALAAPPRPGRPLADAGRRAEVRHLIDRLQQRLAAARGGTS